MLSLITRNPTLEATRGGPLFGLGREVGNLELADSAQLSQMLLKENDVGNPASNHHDVEVVWLRKVHVKRRDDQRPERVYELGDVLDAPPGVVEQYQYRPSRVRVWGLGDPGLVDEGANGDLQRPRPFSVSLPPGRLVEFPEELRRKRDADSRRIVLPRLFARVGLFHASWHRYQQAWLRSPINTRLAKVITRKRRTQPTCPNRSKLRGRSRFLIGRWP